MRLRTLLFGLAVLTPAVASAAPTSPVNGDARSCFYGRDVENYNFDGPNTLYLRANVNEIYRVDIKGGCPDAPFAFNRIALESTPGHGVPICSAINLDVIVPNEGFPEHCLVSGLTRLTPAQVHALPKKVLP